MEKMTCFAEKILKAHAREESKEEIGLAIDQCLTQDSTGTLVWLEFESLNSKLCPKTVSYCDHTSLCFKGESSDDHNFLQSIAKHYGAIFSKNGNGVCHQVHYERFAIPGKTLLGSDSHTPTSGALAMLAFGSGGVDIASALAGSLFYIPKPKIMQVKLTGRLQWPASAKDVSLALLKMLTVKGGKGYILEFTGAVDTLTIPERATIANMGTETGALTSIFPSDNVTREFMRMHGRENEWKELKADINANYDKTIEINLSEIKPLVAMPSSPDNVFSVDEVGGEKINQVYVGSCTNGSYRDIKIFAEMIKGKEVSKDIDVVVSPSSKTAFDALLEDGSIAQLSKAGCRIAEPGCNACIGIGYAPGYGHLSLRTVNRNFPGRGGNEDAKLALCSPQVAAASAIAGKIASPIEFELVKIPTRNFVIDDSLLVYPNKDEIGKAKIVRGPNIIKLAEQKPLSEELSGEVLLKLGDNISTDEILPAGPLTQHLRSNLPAIAEYAFHYKDKEFVARAKKAKESKISCFVIGGENFGQGSSREHAALALWQLGVSAIIAKSYSRIYRANLINSGIIPFCGEIENIEQGDRLIIKINDLKKSECLNITKNTKIVLSHDLSDREIAIAKCGGLLAYSKNVK